MESSHLLRAEHEQQPDLFADEYDALPEGALEKEHLSRRTVRYRLRYYWSRIYHSFLPRRQSLKSPRSRRCNCKTFLKSLAWILSVFVLVSLCHAVFNPSYSNPPERYRVLAERVESSAESGRGNVRGEKIFIAANILDEDLVRGPWGTSLLSLIDLLGEQNVFVSIYENDSGPGTRDALLGLQQKFPCNSSVVTGEHVSLSLMPTITLPDGQERVQRLTYLAEIRNRLLRPLDPSFTQESASGFRSAADVKFDKILFLNDIYFSPLDAVQLLFSTNAESGEAQYRAACAMDFVQLFKLYDTFVVRDTDGYALSLQYYPWFTHLGSGASRADALNQIDAIRVRSCWGGMAAFNATIFQPVVPQQNAEEKQALINPPLGLPNLPIHFRGSEEPFWEAPECCLIFADIEYELGRPSGHDNTDFFINPYIRVAYSPMTWNSLSFFRRMDRFFEYFQTIAAKLKYPEYNPRRLHKPDEMVDEVVWTGPWDAQRHNVTQEGSMLPSPATNQKGHFSLVHRKAQPGGFCGQRRLFVMKQDLAAANQGASHKNWEKVRIPPGVHGPFEA